jgi:hypothetical protein
VGLLSFDEMSLEVTLNIHLANPRSEDEDSSYWEDHVVEIHRALDHDCAASPYLALQLLVFDHR